MKNNYQRILPHVPFLFLFLCMFMISRFIYMYGDDYRYATYFSLFPHFKGSTFSFTQVIENQLYDYTHVNGRFFINIFTIYLLVHGIEFWRWVNPFLLTILAYAIFYAVFVRFPKKGDEMVAWTLVSLFFLVHIYIARQTLFYAVGSFNYVYPMLGLMLLAIFFRRIDIHKPIKHKAVIILFFCLAFLLGWSQEQVSLLTLGLIVCWICKEYIVYRKIKLLYVAFFFTSLIGFLGLYLSPGVKARGASKALASYNQSSTIVKLKQTFPAMIDFFIHQQAIFTILVIASLAIIGYQISKKWYWLLGTPIVSLPLLLSVPFFGQANPFDQWFLHKAYLSFYGIVLICMLVAMSIYVTVQMRDYIYLIFPLGFILINIATVFTPSLTGGRVAFPAIPLAMGSIILLFQAIHSSGIKKQLMIFLIFFAALNYQYLYNEYRLNANIQEKRIHIIKQHQNMKAGELVLPKLKNRSAAGYELNDQEYVMRGFKNYYRINENVTILLK
ncbi:DUF6056 family protein [Shimazuella sp. AN120528]|uniref:DUF6056 family protein n=1 Tax=Shimazuella soli TaxID=1892854 RepID=UPI001F118B8D|nr:DUF6056 family protein [Shimazuella soli]MCH5585507.1 DUF6056 family protein [Shimazuella soli]